MRYVHIYIYIYIYIWGQKSCIDTRSTTHALAIANVKRQTHARTDRHAKRTCTQSKQRMREAGAGKERDKVHILSLLAHLMAISWTHQKGVPACMCVCKHMYMSAKTLRPTSHPIPPIPLKFGATSDKHSVPRKKSVPTVTGLECERRDHDMCAWPNDRQIGRQKNIQKWRAAWTR